MALVKAETLNAQARGFGRLPLLRQFGLLIGLAASVAIGVAIAMWSHEPNYSLLYGGLSDKDSSQVLDALQKAAIPYQIEQGSGAVLVPGAQVHEARLKLASQGLPKGSGEGFELMEKEQGFGTSQFMENARYQHALEGELARTIRSMGNVQDARIHLALPKQSVFVRDRQKPSASVMINLYSGRTLDDGQVAAIVHLVAASVPHLEASEVTVVDQQGHLLTSSDSANAMGLSDSQFKYARRLEESYTKRIEDLLTPLVGQGGVRAQVVADLDFTVTEQTQEDYNPEKTTLRSEQTSEDQSSGSGLGAIGIPGALSNQPPAAGTTVPPALATPAAPGAAAAAANIAATPAQNTSRQATRNFEIDRTISHTRLASGNVKRLSVAVLLDDHQNTTEDGTVERKPLTKDELERYTRLIKEAVGFDEKRGDSVNVINASFQAPPPVEEIPAPPVWKQAWVWDVAKFAAGGLGLIFLLFGVLKPVLRSLAEKGVQGAMGAGGGMMALQGADGSMVADDRVSLSGGARQAQLPGPSASTANYESHLSVAKAAVAQDPKRVAQVVKNWVGTDA